MKNKAKKLLFPLLALAVFAFSVCVQAAGAYNWYCKRAKDHARPAAESSLSFIFENGGAYIGKDPEEKVIYLTFDAGYENGNIAKILDVLKAHNAHGAFFVLENIITRNTDLVKRMAAEGHLVCNHTARHKDMTKMNDADFRAELTRLEDILRERAGVECAKFYRPPEGRFSEANLKTACDMGYKTVFWSLAYADWDNDKQPDPEKAKQLLLANTHNGAVILLHPTSKTNADILDALLTEWESQGYRFGTLDELF
ncbi:MAG: polysaccharide deacetylase family protein [Clostridia bacterium]|nr:polysaccharide deacetylase family protein [Clostridia bacterium]